jgi:hypothetical protein
MMDYFLISVSGINNNKFRAGFSGKKHFNDKLTCNSAE